MNAAVPAGSATEPDGAFLCPMPPPLLAAIALESAIESGVSRESGPLSLLQREFSFWHPAGLGLAGLVLLLAVPVERCAAMRGLAAGHRTARRGPAPRVGWRCLQGVAVGLVPFRAQRGDRVLVAGRGAGQFDQAGPSFTLVVSSSRLRSPAGGR